MITCQCEFGEIMAAMAASSCQHGDAGVRYVPAVGQVQPLELGRVALQQPECGLADIQARESQRLNVPQPAPGRLQTCGYMHDAQSSFLQTLKGPKHATELRLTRSVALW